MILTLTSVGVGAILVILTGEGVHVGGIEST